jgi:uncharacterized repeat protein (TIGR01451 family)
MSLRGTLRSLRNKISKKTAVVAAVVILGIAGGAAVGVKTVSAEHADCNGNAVMYCGAYNLSKLKQKYNASASARAIYAASPFNISNTAFNSAVSSSGFVDGYVNRNNTITVNGRVVATNAVTAGRSYITGSTRMNISGVEAYTRPPSVSFQQARLQAYIKFDANGKFQFAIIKACGNPATGTPTPPPAKPSFTIEKKVRIAGSNSEWKEDVAVAPAQKVEYVVGVTNTGNVALTNMRVRDTLPAGVSYVNNSTRMITSYAGSKSLPNGITNGGINIGTMPAGGVAFVFFEATAPAPTSTVVKVCDTGRTTLVNRAYAKPAELPEQNNTANINTCIPTKPNFTIEKKVKVANTDDLFAENVVADPGTELTFVIGVSNTGNTALKNILVKDVLPAGFSYVPGKATIVTSDGTPTTKISDNLVTTGYTIASLKTGAVAFIFFNAKLPVATNAMVPECKTGSVKLVNKANAKPEGLTVKEDTASAETCKKTPGFEIVKDVRKKGDSAWKQDVTLAYGDTVEYQITVKNTGATDLKNVVVKDARPTGVDYVAGTLKVNGVASTGDLFGAGVTVPEIKIGQTATVSFEAKVMTQPAVCETKTFKNVASAQPTGLNVKQDDANVTANCKEVPKNPAVTITKYVDSVKNKEVAVGQEFTYQLVVKNTGDVNLTNVKVTDPAPAGVQMISTDKGTIVSNALSYTIPSLAVGASDTINIKAKVTAYQAGNIVNTACVNAPEVNPGNPTKDDACDNATVTVKKNNPNVDIEKKVSKQIIPVSGEFVYTLEVTNTGDVALTNVKVTDPAPEGVNFIESTRPEGTTTTVGVTNFEATIANLAVGQKVSFQIKSKVVKEVVGKIVNTACVNAPEVNPGNPAQNDDCDSVEIEVPNASCTALATLSLGEYKYRFTPQISKTSTVTVTNASYNFGDGSAVVTKTDASSVEHQFTQAATDATYTVNATITFNLEGVSKTVSCAAQVKVSATPEEPCPYNPNLPKDDKNCVPPCAYNPELPQNDPNCKPPVTDVCPSMPGVQTNPNDCKTTPVTPVTPITVLPSTGAGSVAVSFVGISTVAYAAAAFMQRRKSLK